MYSSIIYWVSELFSTELKRAFFINQMTIQTKVYLWPHSVPSIHLSILEAPTHYLNYSRFISLGSGTEDFTFLLLLSVFLLPLYSLLCRPPIMVTNLAIIFLIFIRCSPQSDGQREWLSFSNISHFLTHPTDMFTDGTHHYWKYFVYLFIFYCLFPQTKI